MTALHDAHLTLHNIAANGGFASWIRLVRNSTNFLVVTSLLVNHWNRRHRTAWEELGRKPPANAVVMSKDNLSNNKPYRRPLNNFSYCKNTSLKTD